MNRLYFFLLFVAVLGCIYLIGLHAGVVRCRHNFAQIASQQQSMAIKIQEKINAEAIHRTGDDIRRILREKYTISE